MSELAELEQFDKVLGRQVPQMVGEPIPMTVYENDHPKSCGDPWFGAYSKHGFWYKFHDGHKEDFDQLVALACEHNGCLCNYGIYDTFSKGSKNDLLHLIVAKNQMLGGVTLLTCNEQTAVIGTYFVREEYRNSGIGSKLFTEILERAENKTVLFHSIINLAEKCAKFGLIKSSDQWKFINFKVIKPINFQCDQVDGVALKHFDQLSDLERNSLIEFDAKLSQVKRSQWLLTWLGQESFVCVLACRNDKTTVGYGCVREVAGGYLKRVLVGPLYAETKVIAALLLHKLLQKYLIDESDDNLESEIMGDQDRIVHMVVPERNTMISELLEFLKGAGSEISQSRLFFKTQSNRQRVFSELDFNRIYAIADLNFAII